MPGTEPTEENSSEGKEEEQGTRQKLLDAARRTLLEKGHIRSTVKEIAAAAGVNHGLVHHYFRSKEHMFLELLKENPVYREPPVLSGEDENIEYLMDHLFPNTRLHVEFHSLAQEMPEIREAMKSVMQRKRRELQKTIGIQDDVMATLLVAVVSGLVLQYNLDPGLPVREVLRLAYRLSTNGTVDGSAGAPVEPD